MFLPLILGLFIGLSASLLGLGGNILIVPLLPLFTDLPLREVVATGIFTVFFVCLNNVFFFWRQGLIDFRTCLILLIPTSMGSYLSSFYSSRLSEDLIQGILIGIMALMVVKLNLKIKENRASKKPYHFMILGALVSGSLAGITGIGSGVILGPLLLAFGLTDHKKVSPVINVMIVVACFFSSLNYLNLNEWSHYRSGAVHLDLALLMILTSLPSSFLGRKFNHQIDPRLRKRIVSAVLGVLILKQAFL